MSEAARPQTAQGNGLADTAWTGRMAGAGALAVALLFGEAVIVGVAGAARHLTHGEVLPAWPLATAANAVLGFFILGLTQIKAWERGAATAAPIESDPRLRLAVRGLSGGGLLAFVSASVVGGPLAVGWFYGKRRDPRARSLTWTAAWLLAGVWSAVYLGLLAWLF
ncbi:MAG TPA: hypothetical protein VGO92_08710 [Acidimicrobiales bacterium]|jgi:hypothetical protein|nr:hypothetical protein [Acidimicrobiales bacterium]